MLLNRLTKKKNYFNMYKLHNNRKDICDTMINTHHIIPILCHTYIYIYI